MSIEHDVDVGLRRIWELAKGRGRDVEIHIRQDGRVDVLMTDTAGWVKDKVHADFVAGSGFHTPGAAIEFLRMTSKDIGR